MAAGTGRGEAAGERIAARLRREIEGIRRRCLEGEAHLGLLLALNIAENSARLPLTFLTPLEWMNLRWGGVLPPWAGEAWEDACGLRRRDVLFGAWLAWHAQFLALAVVRGRELGARRVSGERIGRMLLEELCSDPETPGGRLFASLGALVNPLAPDILACMTCVLHEANGRIRAAAAAWNVRGAGLGRLEKALLRWAGGKAEVAGTTLVTEDPTAPGPLPLAAAEWPWVLDVPVGEVAARGRGGKVVPFPLGRRHGEKQ